MKNCIKAITLILLVQFAISQQSLMTAEEFESNFNKVEQIFRTSKEFLKQLHKQKDFIKSIVEDPERYFSDRSASFLKQLYSNHLSIIKQYGRITSDDTLKCNRNDGPSFLKFLPTDYLGTLGEGLHSDSIKVEGDCFKDTSFYFNKRSNDSVIINIRAHNSNSWKCSDSYFIGGGLNFHIENIYLGGYKTIILDDLDEKQMESIQYNGLQVFRFCDNLINIVPDIIMTLGLFLGGMGDDPTEYFFGSYPLQYQEYLNKQFIRRSTGVQLQYRQQYYVELDQKEIKSGDLLVYLRLDGKDQMIQYLTGSRIAGTAMAMWIDGELNILSNQDEWYWPQHGIQRTPYEQWIQWAENAGYQVAVLPLSSSSRQQFNVKKAIQFFQKVEGLPYGYSTLLYSWIDSPQSIPKFINPQLFPILLSLLEQFIPQTINLYVSESLSFKLNVDYQMTISDFMIESAKRRISLVDLMSIPESDQWVYADGKAFSSASLVAAIYKASGLLDYQINANEFTAKDIYQLDIFDHEYTRPQICKDADPELPYCQILGKQCTLYICRYRIILTDYNTIRPYDNMNENCPSQPPLYERPDDC